MNEKLSPNAPTLRVEPDRIEPLAAADRMASQLMQRPEVRSGPVADCQQDLWLTVFFDGTGNNRDIDVPTFEHSSIARLNRAMAQDATSIGRRTLYIPGLGTPFREIGDKGGDLGMGLAVGGEGRIAWAMDQVEADIKVAAARAVNGTNKIRSINIAVFGFSRGAATARAFARRIAGKCSGSGTSWFWNDGKYPTRLYFLGLFDTVASSGLPTGARKFGHVAIKAGTNSATGPIGAMVAGVGLFLATRDGHSAWASDLRIPAMVERCVHYCSAHEMRNSFPLDTVLDEGRYPANCSEVYYPGVHSNVGGGYRPGEGARNTNRFAMLSLIPLHAMYGEAVKAGVPLRSFAAMPLERRDDFFGGEASDKQARADLCKRFNHYMATIGNGPKNVGQCVRDHMHMYFRWRIVHIDQKLTSKRAGQLGWDARRLIEYDKGLAAERAQKQARLDALKKEYEVAKDASDAAWSWYCRGRAHEDRRLAYEQAQARSEQAKWAVVEQEAVVNTLPSDAKALIESLDKYDQQFLDDSKLVRASDPKELTPFGTILRDAWDSSPLKDPEILAFFDEYITDSLAGFAKDLTRATEHRWLYQGGDTRYVYGEDSDEAKKRRAEEEAQTKRERQWRLESEEHQRLFGR
jgi:hypothetical protein